jgi:PAS domain S-box-containing protein
VRIGAKLKLAALMPVLLAAVVSLALLFSYRAMEQAQEKGETARRITNSVNQLDYLAFSYLLHHEERPRSQFLLEHDALTRLIAAAPSWGGEQQQRLEDVRRSSEAMRDSFLRLASMYGSRRSAGSDALLAEAEARLAGQVLIRSSHAASDALRLQDLVGNEIITTQRRVNALIFLLIAIATLPLTILLLRMMRNISSSLARLRQGTELVAGGNLDHRVGLAAPDEIGDLSRAFDRMTDQLRTTTVSRDLLSKEVEDRKQAEEALRESRAALQRSHEDLERRVSERTVELRAASRYARSLLEASLDPLVTISPAGKVTDVNRATELVTGVARERLVGSDFSGYFTEPERASAGYQQVIAEGEVRDYPLTIRHASGRTTDVLYNATVYRDEAGEVQGVFAAARDITERRRAEAELASHREHLEELVQERTAALAESQRRLQQANRLLEAVTSGTEVLIAAQDTDFRYTFFNEAYRREMRRLTGADVKIGTSMVEAFAHLPEQQRIAVEHWRRTLAGESSNYRIEFGDPSGYHRIYSVLQAPLRDDDGKVAGAGEVAYDITEQVRAEEEREGLQRQLLEAERARTRLAQALASEVGHRTKNNLAIVAGLLQIQMDQEAATVSGPELIRDAVTRIMAFAALHDQMYQSQRDTIELVDALRRIGEINRQALSAGDITIKVQGEPVHYPSAAGTNICVVANELLTNAIKHSRSQEGGRSVEVQVGAEGGKLVLSVWNSGSAIEEGFDLRSASRTGLGLVRTVVVDQYGGSFTLTGERGGVLARMVLDSERLREGA